MCSSIVRATQDRWKIEWEEEEIDQWEVHGYDGQIGLGRKREWVDGERVMLIVQPKGSEIIRHLMEDRKFWIGRLQGWKWKRREWSGWVRSNPDWAEQWERPSDWLPGEKAWFEGDESWDEVKRPQKEDVRLSPHGATRTGLTEPCGALPRKCLFIYLSYPIGENFGRVR
jgi:hypothetical protein